MQLMGDREKWHELSDNKIYAGDVSHPFFFVPRQHFPLPFSKRIVYNTKSNKCSGD